MHRRNRFIGLKLLAVVLLILVVAAVPLADTFLALTDTPSSYSGQGGRFVRVETSSPDELIFDPYVLADNTAKLSVKRPSGEYGYSNPWTRFLYSYYDIGRMYMGSGWDWFIEATYSTTELRLKTANNQAIRLNAGTGTVYVDDNLEIDDDVQIDHQLYMQDFADANNITNAHFGSDDEDGGFMFWSDADWYTTCPGVEFWDTTEAPGPEHALWCRWMVQYIPTGEIQSGEGIIEPGETLHLFQRSADPRLDVRIDWDDPPNQRIYLHEFGGDSNGFRVSLMMMWIGD